MMRKKIFITGGAGYCGSRLVPYLLERDYQITVYDLMYFTDGFLPKNHPNLNIIKGDIRDVNFLEDSCRNHDYFISLACISNDASFELDEKLSTSINFDAFEPMVKAAKKSNIKRFIYASSSSVYGVSEAKEIREDHPLVPLTLYNDFKGKCEPILLNHTNENFEGVIFRPATVCGYAPRLRLDLSVNILTNHAINNNKITVFGGEQLRPNLHILDYCRAVNSLIEAPVNKVKNQIFNVGFQNLSILEIAHLVKKVVQNEFNKIENIPIEIEKSDDNRSYHINSDKISNVLGFKATQSIENAVLELCNYFKLNPKLDTFENNIYHNVKRIRDINAK